LISDEKMIENIEQKRFQGAKESRVSSTVLNRSIHHPM
jgi:hypothetical protein